MIGRNKAGRMLDFVSAESAAAQKQASNLCS